MAFDKCGLETRIIYRMKAKHNLVQLCNIYYYIYNNTESFLVRRACFSHDASQMGAMNYSEIFFESFLHRNKKLRQ